jgi:hypothetical protein
VEPTRKATVVREMHSGLERIRHIVKKTFGRSKMQGVKLLTRDLFVSDTGLALTSEVIILVLTLSQIGYQFYIEVFAMFFIHIQ